MTAISYFKLGAGQRAYLTMLLQNDVFNPVKAAEYAKKQWGLEVDVSSIEAYMKGLPDPFSSVASTADIGSIPELAITDALSRDASKIEPGLGLMPGGHQYVLPSGKRIDLLCKDKDGRFVVVELKKYATRDVIDQLLGYMAELRSTGIDRQVRGIILSSTVEADLESKVRILEGAGITKYYKLNVDVIPKPDNQ